MSYARSVHHDDVFSTGDDVLPRGLSITKEEEDDPLRLAKPNTMPENALLQIEIFMVYRNAT